MPSKKPAETQNENTRFYHFSGNRPLLCNYSAYLQRATYLKQNFPDVRGRVTSQNSRTPSTKRRERSREELAGSVVTGPADAEPAHASPTSVQVPPRQASAGSAAAGRVGPARRSGERAAHPRPSEGASREQLRLRGRGGGGVCACDIPQRKAGERRWPGLAQARGPRGAAPPTPSPRPEPLVGPGGRGPRTTGRRAVRWPERAPPRAPRPAPRDRPARGNYAIAA